jgi:hypothetical protein
VSSAASTILHASTPPAPEQLVVEQDPNASLNREIFTCCTGNSPIHRNSTILDETEAFHKNRYKSHYHNTS